MVIPIALALGPLRERSGQVIPDEASMACPKSIRPSQTKCRSTPTEPYGTGGHSRNVSIIDSKLGLQRFDRWSFHPWSALVVTSGVPI